VSPLQGGAARGRQRAGPGAPQRVVSLSAFCLGGGGRGGAQLSERLTVFLDRARIERERLSQLVDQSR